MNFIEELILSSSSASEIDLEVSILKLQESIMRTEEEMKKYLDDFCTELTPFLKDNTLVTKAQNLSTQMEDVCNRIETQTKNELESSMDELKNVGEMLEETDECLNIIQELSNIWKVVELIKDDQCRKHYLDAADNLKHAQSVLSKDNKIQNLYIHKSLVAELAHLESVFLDSCLREWRKFFTCKEHCSKDKVEIEVTITKSPQTVEAIGALHRYDRLDYEVSVLSKKLLEILISVTRYKSVVQLKSAESEILNLTIHKYEQNPSCSDIIEILRIIYTFLFQNLMIDVNSEFVLVKKFADFIEPTDEDHEFYKSLTNVIICALSKTSADFKQLDPVVEKIVDFDKFLKEKGFLSESNDIIHRFVDEEALHCNMHRMWLSEARDILRKGLHRTVRIGLQVSNKSELENDTNICLCENTFRFPSCCISESTSEFLSLLYRIVESKDTDCCISPFDATRDVITLYYDLMPELHKNLLRSVPQYSAVFYNSCMYVAHHVAMFQMDIPSPVMNTSVDFVDLLRRLGQHYMFSQIEAQQKHIIKVVKDSGLSQAVSVDADFASIEKSFTQILRQLSFLQSVWLEVLPLSVYCQYIGYICDTFLEEVITKVMAMEDISADAATELAKIFNVVTKKVPSVFPDPKEVYRHVKKLSKFNELLNVLISSLRDIDDRWSDGKGPLAQEFSADQLKHLVRALFQNTDRRSALLSRIK